MYNDVEGMVADTAQKILKSALPKWREVQDWATDGAADWAVGLSVASQLPGRLDGPADAFRHLLIAAELHRVYGQSYAGRLLEGHEFDFGHSSDMDMDNYNNEIGREIGRYVRSNNGSTADVIKFAKLVMLNSFPGGGSANVRWEPGPETGWRVKAAKSTQLPNGVVLQPAVVAQNDPDKWLTGNPVDNETGQHLATKNVNWPGPGWEKRFDYTGVDKAWQYLRRNRPAQWTESAEPTRPGPGTKPGARPGNPHGPESRKRDRGDLRDLGPGKQPDPNGFSPGRSDLFEPSSDGSVEPRAQSRDRSDLQDTAPASQINPMASHAGADELDIYQMAEEVFSGLTLDDWATIPDDNDPFDNRDPFANGVKWVPGIGLPPANP